MSPQCYLHLVASGKGFKYTSRMPASLFRLPLASNRIRASSLRNTFGLVRAYPDGKPKPHQGWDFSANIGTSFFAIADGTVVDVRNEGNYGQQLLLQVGDGQYAFYAHLSRIDVAEGQKVAKGQALGLTGNSGNAEGLDDTEDHLHFEARTVPHPPKGLEGRVSPLGWFGSCPLKTAVLA